MQERFIGPGRVDVTAGRNVFADNKVGSVFYTDATVRYAFRFADREMQAFLTVNNVFNRNPPIVPTIPFGSYRATNFSLYDVLGRYYTVGLKARF
jgi:outer membrane receptor protein involved in Fe transport